MARITLGPIPGTEFLFGHWPYYLHLSDREIAAHKHVLGIAGCGKSKLLESMWLQLTRQGIGATLIDPHGSSAEALLKQLIASHFFDQPGAFNRLLYVEFSSEGPYFPMNVLQIPFANQDDPSETAGLVIESFMRAYPELPEGAANFKKLMDASLKVLIANNEPIVVLQDMLLKKEVRDRLLANVRDPRTVDFFRALYDKLTPYELDRQRTSTLNRAYDIASSNLLMYVLGQQENRFDFRDILDHGRAVIVNLGPVRSSKVRRLLGAFITHGYEQAAMSRTRFDLPSHHLLLDEFSQFSAQSSESLAEMLDQTRKYGLFLTMAHQTWSQTDARMSGALQNAMVKICFLVGPEDAALQARAFADIDPYAVKLPAASDRSNPLLMTVQDQYESWSQYLRTQEPRHAVVRLGIAKPQVIRTLDIPEVNVTQSQVDDVKTEYFRRFYVPREQIVLPHERPWNQGNPPQRIKK